MSIFLIILLILIGLSLVVLEIIVIPGAIAGIIGALIIIFAIWESFEVYGNTYGYITLFSTLFVTAIALYFTLKSKTWNKLMLNTKINSKVNVIENEIVKVGDYGISISRLAPAGKAMINGEFYEVHTNSEFIDQNQDIIIIKIDHNKIIVKQFKH
jgi:membrane-bound ClpP family serine protease